MYKKLLTAAVLLLAFAGMQLVSTLNCYFCESTNSTCGQFMQQTCTETTANYTTNALKKSFSNVPDVRTQNFDCMTLSYNKSDGVSTAIELRGCVYRETYPCSLTVIPTVGGTWAKHNCTTCSGNLCNSRNPAGTYSSSVFTMFACVLSVLVAKMFAH